MLVAADFKTHLYPELQTAIDRGDNTILQEAIEAAEGEAKGYLSYYDTDTLFSAEGDARDAALMLFLKDIAIWHFILLANPNTDLELRKTRYDDAKKWLRDVQKGHVVQKEWPLPDPTPSGSGAFLVSSQPKRDTRY